MTETILLVDDEQHIIDLAKMYLEQEGWKTTSATDGLVGLQRIMSEKPSLVVLDLMLPGLDGWEVCRRVRAQSDIPIIMLTARSDDIDKIVGLELGADDYMTKPFQIAEMTARIEAVLRRTTMSNSVPEKIDFNDGRLLIDLAKRHVTLEDKELELTPKEYELLRELVLNAGIVLQYDYILKKIWGDEYKDEKQLVYAVAKRLRAKLEVNPKNPKYIIAISGVGYRFKEIS